MNDISKYLLFYGAVLLLILSKVLNEPSETLIFILRFSAFLLLTIRCFFYKNKILILLGFVLLFFITNEYFDIINSPYLDNIVLSIVAFCAVVFYIFKFSNKKKT